MLIYISEVCRKTTNKTAQCNQGKITNAAQMRLSLFNV
jgi:hypothetical protein